MNTPSYPIVTIGRQLGSGGYLIGKELAQRLNLKFFNKELLLTAARETGMCPNIFEEVDEKAGRGFSKILSTIDFYGGAFYDPSLTRLSRENLFAIQSRVLKKVAGEGPCLFIGRCADYILRDFPTQRSLFIHAPLDFRIARVAARDHITPTQAEAFIKKQEKTRASYYEYFTNKKWGHAASYHFSLDSGLLGLDGCVEAAAQLLQASWK